MFENMPSDSSEPQVREIYFDTSTPPGTRLMNLLFGFPILLIAIGATVYVAIEEKQPMYLFVSVGLLIVAVVAAKILFFAPASKTDAQSLVNADNHPQFVKSDTGNEN